MTKVLAKIFLVSGCCLALNASAALVDRGNGLIYDSELNVTWLADANFARTSGHSADGRLSWGAATQWVEALDYQGYTDWRLPRTLQPDLSCEFNDNLGGGSLSYGFGCSGSELGHMFHNNLGGLPGGGLSSATNAGAMSLLSIVEPAAYWSSTILEAYQDYAWLFLFWNGDQDYNALEESEHWYLDLNDDGDYDYLDFGMFAWALRDGDVTGSPVSGAVPEPSSMLLLGSAIAGLAAVRRRLRGATKRLVA